LEPGAVDPVKRRVLIDQLGTKLAGDLGITDDAEAPRRARWASRKGQPKVVGKAQAKAPAKSPGRVKVAT
jgi:hypothetical protein